MLNIYIGKENLPSHLIFAEDVDSVFRLINFNQMEISKHIVKEIEQGEVIDINKWRDRFGITLYADSISSGSKAAIIASQPGYVSNGMEMGLNVLQLFLTELDGNIFFKQPINSYLDPDWWRREDIQLNGKPCAVDEMEDLLW